VQNRSATQKVPMESGSKPPLAHATNTHMAPADPSCLAADPTFLTWTRFPDMAPNNIVDLRPTNVAMVPRAHSVCLMATGIMPASRMWS
jgi:hypothetical protein